MTPGKWTSDYSMTAKEPAALRYQTMKSVAMLIPTYTLPVLRKKYV
jgi:hypothetical protein